MKPKRYKLNGMTAVSKAKFAELMGVTRGRVSQWLRAGQINGMAIVGAGLHAKIDVEAAQEQLRARLEISQRLGANGRARLNGGGIEDDIKAERLAQLRLLNRRAVAEEALQAGAYVKAVDVRQQFGNVAARLMSTFEASFMLMANAIVASRAQTPHDVLRVMRSTWREARAQAAKAQGEEALALPPLLDEEAVDVAV